MISTIHKRQEQQKMKRSQAWTSTLKFSDRKSCESEDIILSVCHLIKWYHFGSGDIMILDCVIWQDHVIKK